MNTPLTPNLVKVTDRWNKTRIIDKNELDNPRRSMLNLYTRRGNRVQDLPEHRIAKEYDGCAFIIRANIVGTPEHAESMAKVAELLNEWSK